LDRAGLGLRQIGQSRGAAPGVSIRPRGA
jgi:hypothetical protein